MRPGASVFHTWRHHYGFSIRARLTSPPNSRLGEKKQWNSASSVWNRNLVVIAWFCVLKIDSASDSHARLLAGCYFLHLCCSVRPKKWQKAFLKLVVSGCKMACAVGRARGFAAFPGVVNNRGHLAMRQGRSVCLNWGGGGDRYRGVLPSFRSHWILTRCILRWYTHTQIY